MENKRPLTSGQKKIMRQQWWERVVKNQRAAKAKAEAEAKQAETKPTESK